MVLSAFPSAGPPAGSQGPQSCFSFSVSASAWLTVTHASELGSVCYFLWGASWHLAPHGAFPNAYLDIVCGIVLLLTSYPPPPKFIVLMMAESTSVVLIMVSNGLILQR